MKRRHRSAPRGRGSATARRNVNTDKKGSPLPDGLVRGVRSIRAIIIHHDGKFESHPSASETALTGAFHSYRPKD